MRGFEQSLSDEAEGTRFWWEGIGSNRLMVRASQCSRRVGFLRVVSPSLSFAYPSKKGGQ